MFMSCVVRVYSCPELYFAKKVSQARDLVLFMR